MSRDAEKRKALAEAKAKVREILKPEREARKIVRAKVRKASKAARQSAPMKGQREPRVEDRAYLAWLRRKPCLGCGRTPCDAAHIRFTPPGSGWKFVGMGHKPDDFRAVPLCRKCHRNQHSMREETYWRDILKRCPVSTVNALRAEYLGEAA